MKKFKYLVVGDLHLDSKAPSPYRIDDYEATCFNKLEDICNITREEEVDAVFFLGDWFHRKNPSSIPHRLLTKLYPYLEELYLTTGEVHTILGNHDLGPYLWENHPLNLVFKTKFVNDLSNSFRLWSGVTKPIVVSGRPFKAPIRKEGVWRECEDNYKVVKLQDAFNIVLAHGACVSEPVAWEGHSLIEEVMKTTDADIVHCGHIHDNLGIHKYGNKWFANVGSVTRGALKESEIDREPIVLVTKIDTESLEVSFKPIGLPSAKSANEVYDLQSYAKIKREKKDAEAWTVKLQKEFETDEPEEELETVIQQSSLDYACRSLALGILNELGA